jgi:hypothetical protein
MERFGERFVAEVKADSWHLRLFSEFTVTGPMALVWDMKTNQPIIHTPAKDLNEGREKCEVCVKGLLLKSPIIVWARQP